MAERAALLQCAVSDGWEVSLSEWGGTDRALSAICAGVAPSKLPVSWEYDRTVGDFGEAVAGLDYLGTELLYREGEGQTAFLVLWFGLPLARADCHLQAGTVVEVHSLHDATTVRAGFREFKGVLADAIEAATLPASAAPVALLGSIHALQGRERYVVWQGAHPSDVLYRERGPEPP